MKWRTESYFPEKSGMYITELEIKEDGVTYNPVAYNYFDSILSKWPNPRTCSEDAKVTKWLDESTPSKEGEEEAVEILNWLAHINVNGYKGTEFSEIILVDGEYYYKLDEDGDQPITPQQLYKIFKQSKATTG